MGVPCACVVLRVIGDEACPLPPFLQVVIDVVKHGVLGKFNDVRPGIYREFMKDLCEKVGGWLGVAVYIGWVWVVGSTRLGGVWVVGRIRLGGGLVALHECDCVRVCMGTLELV